jgi:hypothetical protein
MPKHHGEQEKKPYASVDDLPPPPLPSDLARANQYVRPTSRTVESDEERVNELVLQERAYDLTV